MTSHFGRHRGGRRHRGRGWRGGYRGFAPVYGPYFAPYYEPELVCSHDEETDETRCRVATVLAGDATAAVRPWHKRPLVVAGLVFALACVIKR